MRLSVGLAAPNGVASDESPICSEFQGPLEGVHPCLTGRQMPFLVWGASHAPPLGYELWVLKCCWSCWSHLFNFSNTFQIV